MLSPTPRRRLLVLYWGQRGAMSRFTLALGKAAKTMDKLDVVISVSRQNELFSEFMHSGAELFPISTFSSRLGSVGRLYRIASLRRSFAECLSRKRVEAVVNLMPHVWSPFVSGIVKRMRIPYAVIIHDAKGHLGDPTSLVNHWLYYDAFRADRIITLSRFVADELVRKSSIPRDRLASLFLPHICSTERPPEPRRRDRGSSLRLLFFGRILPYKGLPLFVSAAEKVRASGVPIEIGVFGEGSLGREGQRLDALGATVVNRWIPEAEIGRIFSQYDALVASHIEASQSGVAALALGSGLPVVTTPIGGLTEQVNHESNGLVAESATVDALAAQIIRLATDWELYRTLSETASRGLPDMSMEVFLEKLAACCLSQAPYCTAGRRR